MSQETGDDIKQKTAGAYVRRLLKVEEKRNDGIPFVLWRELLGGLLLNCGIAGGVLFGIAGAAQVENIAARMAIWSVIAAIVFIACTAPAKLVLKGTRSALAAVLAIWLPLPTTIGVIWITAKFI